MTRELALSAVALHRDLAHAEAATKINQLRDAMAIVRKAIGLPRRLDLRVKTSIGNVYMDVDLPRRSIGNSGAGHRMDLFEHVPDYVYEANLYIEPTAKVQELSGSLTIKNPPRGASKP
jgi:hypothetical protein